MNQEVKDKSTHNNLMLVLKFDDHWEVQIQGHGVDLVGKSPEEMFKQHLHFLYNRFLKELENERLISLSNIKS